MKALFLRFIFISAVVLTVSVLIASNLTAAATTANTAPALFDQTHAMFSQLLKIYQNEKKLINYLKLKNDIKTNSQHLFLNYIKEIQGVPYATFNKWTDQNKMAFLINSYNALTIKLVIDHYPVVSIKKIGGFFTKPWDVKFFSLLDGKIRSLDPIEHIWLRPVYKDYRIHAAINCASLSCPTLRNEAYQGVKITKQLDEQMRLWINDPNLNYYDQKNKILRLSKIFDWYKVDFEQWGGGMLKVFNKYIAPTLADETDKKSPQLKIKFLDYNWSLNEFK